MTKYTVEAERGKLRWSLQAIEAPGAISEVDRLSQVDLYMKEAISFVTGEPEDSIEIELVPILDEVTKAHLRKAHQLQEDAKAASAAATAERQSAARRLQEAGLTLREVGTLLGVSHQRAQQLVTA
jgi:hypothetical protein